MICQDFPSKIFCLTVLKNSVRRNPLGFHYFRLSKKFGSEVGRVSRISVENFLSHGAEKIQRGESFSISLISGNEKVWMKRGGEYQDFPSKIFCLTVPINFVGELFSVSLILRIERFYDSQ